MMSTFSKTSGFTLIEMAMIIVVVGILAAVATQQISKNVESSQYAQTTQEMEQLAFAILGNPNVYTNGIRTDFGYVGDVGALPDSLGALVNNPGGYTTWDGPYIGSGYNDDDFKKDGWGKNYSYYGTSIYSSGGPTSITKTIVSDAAYLTSNTVQGFVVDANHDVPGVLDSTSITVLIEYPDGAGEMTSQSLNPSPNGNFSFTSIPIGAHTLRLVYEAENDTVSYSVAVEPNTTVKLSLTFPADLW